MTALDNIELEPDFTHLLPKVCAALRRKLGCGPHRMRAKEMEKVAEHWGGLVPQLDNRRLWVTIYWQFLRAWYRSEAKPDEATQRAAILRAMQGAWRFNTRWCVPPLQQVVFEDVILTRPRWAGRPSWEVASRLKIMDKIATELKLESLISGPMRDKREWAKRKGVRERRAKRERRADTIARLIGDGLSDIQVALKVGVNRTTVWEHRKRIEAGGAST